MTLHSFLREQRAHQRVFVEAHGPWPHDCIFCGSVVDGHTVPFDRGAAVVHHADGDHGNDAPGNLVPAHLGCHSRHHGHASPETRAKMRAAAAGRTLTLAHRAAISAAQKGKPRGPLSPEHRAKIGAANRKPLSPKALAAQRRAVSSPEGRARLREASMAIPHASCVNCRREFRIGAPLAMHLRACAR